MKDSQPSRDTGRSNIDEFGAKLFLNDIFERLCLYAYPDIAADLKSTIQKLRSAPPSPEREQAKQDETSRSTAKSRSVHQAINKDGIVAYKKRRGK